MRWPTIDHFDLVAPFYDRVISHINLERLLQLLDLPPGGRLLDIGGGTGRVSSLMAGRTGQVVVIDLSRGMLRQAGARPGLQPANARAERLPFPSGSFDRILMVDAFHHVGDQFRTAAELLRVLAPGGRIVIEEPNIETFAVKVIALAEKLTLMRSHFVPPAVMAAMFERDGGCVTLHQVAQDRFNVWLVVDSQPFCPESEVS